MPLKKFDIFSPVLGLKEDQPDVTLPEVFMSDNRNVLLRNGVVSRVKKPAPELTTGGTITGQELVFADNGAAADTITTASGFLAQFYGTGRTITVADSTSNDGTYTIASMTDTVLTLVASDTLTNETTSGATITSTSSGGGHGNKVQSPDGFPFLKYHYFEKNDGNNYLFGFTKQHIYYWNTTSKAWDLKFTSSAATTTHWSVCTFNDVVVATNNIDKVIQWPARSGTDEATAGTFGPVDTASGIDVSGSATYLTTARYLSAFENHLVLGGVTVGGTFYASHIYWCAIGDIEDWSGTGSGSSAVEGADSISGFGLFSDFLMIFKEQSILRMWLTSDATLIFNMASMSRSIGTQSPDSIVQGVSGELYFFAQDYTVRAIVGITSEFPIISQNIPDIMDSIPNSSLYSIKSKYTKKYRQLMFALKMSPSATANDTVLIYADGAWTRHDMTVTAFGEYERTNSAWTIDTIPSSQGTIDSILFDTIDGVDQVTGYRTDIISDASGYTYTMFGTEVDTDGSTYEGYFVIGTDFSGSKGPVRDGTISDMYKRLLFLRLYFLNKPTGTVTLSIRPDFSGVKGGEAFTSIGTIDLSEKTDEMNFWDIPCDVRAKHFQLKVACSTPFVFVGATFEYILYGSR